MFNNYILPLFMFLVFSSVSKRNLAFVLPSGATSYSNPTTPCSSIFASLVAIKVVTPFSVTIVPSGSYITTSIQAFMSSGFISTFPVSVRCLAFLQFRFLSTSITPLYIHLARIFPVVAEIITQAIIAKNTIITNISSLISRSKRFPIFIFIGLSIRQNVFHANQNKVASN
jgi:hypothetical protein